jgi:hypothetical protein
MTVLMLYLLLTQMTGTGRFEGITVKVTVKTQGRQAESDLQIERSHPKAAYRICFQEWLMWMDT